MSAPTGFAGPEREVAVPAAELNEWATLVGFLEDWLIHAEQTTLADYTDFAADALGGPARIEHTIEALGAMTVRIHRLLDRTRVAW